MYLSIAKLLTRFFICGALLCSPLNDLFAQEAAEEPAKVPTVTPVSAKQETDNPEQAAEAKDPTLEEPAAPETFTFPSEQHLWAKFEPGAWREMKTITGVVDENNQTVSRNVTTQKEILEKITDDGKYVLKTQTTVKVGGKLIVGEWQTRVLLLETDSAGPMTETRRLEDQPLQIAGPAIPCQVWEILYREGSRNLRDVIHFNSNQFPCVLRRETFEEVVPLPEGEEPASLPAEQTTEVLALGAPLSFGTQWLDCSFVRTLVRDAKGDTIRFVHLNDAIPGGAVVSNSTDYNPDGQRIGWTSTTLLSYGITSTKVEGAQDDPTAE